MAGQNERKQAIHVLVADHDRTRLERSCRRLLAKGCDLSTTSNASGLTEMMERLSPDLILVDVLMPGFHGEEMSRLLARCPPTGRPAVVVHTAILPRFLRRVVDLHDVLGVIRATENDADFSRDFDAILESFLSPSRPRAAGPRARSGTHRIDTFNGETTGGSVRRLG